MGRCQFSSDEQALVLATAKATRRRLSHLFASYIPLPCLRENGTRLGFPPAAEVTLVRGVLLDIGGIALFRGVGMMFVLRQLFSFDISGVLVGPFLLRLAGGTGGIWLDMIQPHAARR
jgi:hypothetical protein